MHDVAVACRELFENGAEQVGADEKFERVAGGVDGFVAAGRTRHVFDIGILAIHVARRCVLVTTCLTQLVQRDRYQQVFDIVQIREVVTSLLNPKREADQRLLYDVFRIDAPIQFVRNPLGHDAHEFQTHALQHPLQTLAVACGKSIKETVLVLVWHFAASASVVETSRQGTWYEYQISGDSVDASDQSLDCEVRSRSAQVRQVMSGAHSCRTRSK